MEKQLYAVLVNGKPRVVNTGSGIRTYQSVESARKHNQQYNRPWFKESYGENFVKIAPVTFGEGEDL